MITKQEAIQAHEFHEGPCTRKVGPRGGVTIKQRCWRRNGLTQTWKTRPDDYRVPVKLGLKTFGQIRPEDAHLFHTAETCPLSKQE